MNEIILKISPVVFIFFLGYVLKRSGFLKKRDADLLLKIVFYISLPALIILSITMINPTKELIYLPLIAPIIIFVTFLISSLVGKLLRLKQKTMGSFLVGSMIINISFVLPFIVAAYGQDGLARISLFDLGNGVVVLTFVYYVAWRHGGGTKSRKIMLNKFLSSVPIWALLLAILFNLVGIPIPAFATIFLQSLGNLLTPLLMLSMGIYFSPKIIKLVSILPPVILRSFFGLMLGFILVKLFSLEGMNRLVVLVGSAAPVGFNTLTFSSLENLDKEYASSLVSVSILVGIFFIPVLIALLA